MKTLQERYPRLYRALVAQGHDPAKAIEILLDAKRGDAHALNWLRVIARMDRPDDPMRDHYERLAFAAEMRGDPAFAPEVGERGLEWFGSQAHFGPPLHPLRRFQPERVGAGARRQRRWRRCLGGFGSGPGSTRRVVGDSAGGNRWSRPDREQTQQ